MKKITFVIGALSAIFLTTTSFAEITANRPGAVTFTMGEGYDWFSAKRHINNTSMPNAALAYNFDEHLAAEVMWANINTTQKATNGYGLHGNLFMADGIYRFAQHGRLQPYVLAGIGVQGLKTSNPGFNSTQQGNFNAGVGAQLFQENWVAFRGEVRDIYTTSGGYNDVMANVGLSFIIG